MGKIGEAVLFLKTDDSQFSSGLQQAEKQVESFEERARRVGEGLKDVAGESERAGQKLGEMGDIVSRSTMPRFRQLGSTFSNVASLISGASAMASIFARGNEDLQKRLQALSLGLAASSTAVRTFGAALNLIGRGPIGLVITGLGIAAAAGIALARNWDAAVQAATRLWQTFAAFLSRLWGGIATAAQGLGKVLLGALTFWKPESRDLMQEGLGQLQRGLSDLKDIAVDLGMGIKDLVVAGWEKLGELFDSTEKKAKDTRDALADFLKGLPIEAAQAWINMAARWEAAAKSLLGALGSFAQAPIFELVKDPKVLQGIEQMGLRWKAMAESVLGAIGTPEEFEFLELVKDPKVLQGMDQMARRWEAMGTSLLGSLSDPTEWKKVETRVFDLGAAIKDVFADAFTDGMRNLENFGDALNSLINSLLNALTRHVGEAAFQFLFPTKKAHGGPFSAFQPLLVGEAGPELAMFPRSGTIVPHHELSGAGGGVMVNVEHMDLRGAQAGVGVEVRRAIAEAIQIAENRSVARVQDEFARGGAFRSRMRR